MNLRLPGTAEPLPECELCGDPTRRDVHRRTGGFCSSCARETTVRIEPIRVVDDRTAYVEKWLPPVPGVPGQLELGEQ